MTRNFYNIIVKEDGDSITPDGYKIYNVQMELDHQYLRDSDTKNLKDSSGYFLTVLGE